MAFDRTNCVTVPASPSESAEVSGCPCAAIRSERSPRAGELRPVEKRGQFMTGTSPMRSILRRGFLLALLTFALLSVSLLPDSGVSAQTSATLIKNTGQTSAAIVEGLDDLDYAQRFRTGSAPHGYIVTSVGLPFKEVADASVAYTVSIYTVFPRTGMGPDQKVGDLTRPNSLSANSVNTWTSPGIYLEPNTDYWVVIDGNSGAVNRLSLTSSGNEDAGGASGWSLADKGRVRAKTRTGTGGFGGDSTHALQLQIGGYARAETPLVGTALQSNDGDFSLGTRDRAQSFRTGAHANGYIVRAVALHVSDVTSASTSYEVTLTTSFATAFGRLRPNQELATLTAPATLTADSLNVWTSPRGVYLAPNTDYFVLVDSSSAANNFLEVTSSDAEDGGGHAGWSVGNDSIRRNRTGGIWTDDGTLSLKMQLSGHARATSGTSPPTTPVVNSDPASPTTLSVSWRAPDAAVNLPITSYDVQYRVQGSTAAWTNGPQDRTTTTASLTGLTEGTAYEVQVRATGSEGDSAWSASGYGTAGAEASGFVVRNTLQANEFVSNVIVSTHDVFQPFTTGSRADGFRITSVDLLFLHVADEGATPPNVGIYVDRGSGLPGDRVGALFTRPARLVAANDGVNTWTSPGIDLEPGTTYLLGVIGAGDAAHIVRNSSSANEDAGGLEGWSLGDSQNWRTRGTSSYTPIAKSLKMRMSGHATGDSQPATGTLISNTGQTDAGSGSNRNLWSFDVAQGFRTGANTHGYTVTAASFDFAAVGDASASYPLGIYTLGVGGSPGQLVASLNPPNSLVANSLNTWTSPGIYLAPNTDYVLFLDSSSSALNTIKTKSSGDEDAGGAAGWSIVDFQRARISTETGSFGLGGAPFSIEISGYARSSSAPTPPTTPLVNSDPDSPTTLTATWLPPDIPVNLTATYDLRYKASGGTNWSQGPQNLATTSGTITALTADTTYEVQVRAGVGSDHSIWTASGYGTAGDHSSGAMIANTGQANEFSDNTNLQYHDVFQPFTTGPSHEGYRVTNLEIMFLHVEPGRRGTVPQIAIFEERSPGTGLPGDRVGALFTQPTRLVAGNDGLNVWTSPGIDLDPSTTYLIGVVTTGNAPHIVRNTTSSSFDGGAQPGWTIVFGNNRRTAGTSTYAPVFKSLKTRIFGYAEPGNPPVFAHSSYSRRVEENSAGGVNVGDPITATDGDGDTLTYSLGGRDAASFNLNSATGQVTTRDGVTYDHEGKNTFRLTVTATDGITPVTVDLTILLDNVNEPGDNPCGPDPIEARTFAGWTTDERGRYDVDEVGPGVYRKTLQENCYNGGHRTSTHYHFYEFTLTEQTKIMLVLESDLRQLTPDEYVDGDPDTPGFQPVFVRFGSYMEWFDPYLILLRNDGAARTFVADNDDINGQENRSSAIIRTLMPGTYTVYATSYVQGVGGAFRLLYFHEDSDNDPALEPPARRIELGEYTDWDFVRREHNASEPGPDTVATEVAVSETGRVSWKVDRDAVDDRDGYAVYWQRRTAAPGDDYRHADVGWLRYHVIGVGKCLGEDCAFRIPDFDPDFTYRVSVKLVSGWNTPDVTAWHTATPRVSISETGEISWTADADPPDGQHYWLRWRSDDESAPNDVGYEWSQELYGYTRIDHDGSSCGSDGVCRVQIPSFDSELFWLAEVWPRLGNSDGARWPGRWPAPEGPEDRLSGLSATLVVGDGTVLDVSWDALDEADEYLVQWKSGSDDYNTGVERTETSYRITGLTKGTEYTVQVSAIDTDEDPEATLDTREVQGLTWTDQTQRSLAENASFNVDVGEPVTPIARGSGVRYSLGGDDAASFAIDAATGQIRTIVTADYDYETKNSYSVTVTATRGSESVSLAVTIRLTDVDEPPLAPDAPTVRGATETSLTVSWTAPRNDGRPPISDYDVQYRTGGGSWQSLAHEGAATTATITRLTSGSVYEVQVRAHNDEGESSWSPSGSRRLGLLVANTGQQQDSTPSLGQGDWAQSFTTGANAGGYTLTGIGLRLGSLARPTVSYTVEIFDNVELLSDGRPRNKVGTLNRTGSLVADAVNYWTHDGLNLNANTKYWLVIDGNNNSLNLIFATNSFAEDSDSEAGWSISDFWLRRGLGRTGPGNPNWWFGRTSGLPMIEAVGEAKAAGVGRAPATLDELSDLTFSPVAGDTTRLAASWAAFEGADKYRVQWKTGSDRYNTGQEAADTNYTISGLTAGTSYVVQVTALDTDADAELASGEARGTTLPAMGEVTVAPVSGSEDSLEASWDAVTLAAGYVVEWKTDGGSYNTVTRSDVTATRETITGLTPGTTYTVLVTARHNIDGVVADGDSAEGSGTTNGEPPVSFVIYHDPDAGSAAVSRYDQAVALLAAAGIDYTEVTENAQTEADRLAGVTNSVLPRFFLGDPTAPGWTSETKVNNGGLRWLKAKVAELEEEDTEELSALTGLGALASPGKTTELLVSWSAFSGAEMYRVEQKVGTDGTTAFVASSAGTQVSRNAFITGLSPGTTYTIRVTAIDTDPDPDKDVAVAETTATTLPAMGTLTVTPVTGSDDSLDVSWNAVAGAVGYVVEYKTTGGSYQSVARSSATATTERITGLSAETTYTVRVTARHNIAGTPANGDSAEGSATTNAPPPPPGPASLAGLSVSPVSGKTKELAVSWTAVTDADKYVVSWKTGGADFNTGDESTNATHTITGLSAGTTYTVKVTAIDTDADPDAELAAGETGGTTLAAMGTVTVAPVSGSGDSLDVSWPAVSGATGYKVEWKTGTDSYTAVTRSDATATTERVTGLSAGTTYTVRVTARHTIGGVASDGDSAEGSGTTNAAASDTAPVGPVTTTDEAAPALSALFSVIGAGTSYSWAAMETVGGSAVTGYTIQWATDPGGPWTALNAPGEGRRCVPGMTGTGCYFEYAASLSPSGVSAGSAYHLRLIAHAGNVSSAPGPVLEDTLR